mmetsp:Transcript_35438/g.55332  ORF Transcript_35438/g.55332 Transcript_35438/m.55332 type:complete len:82 (-) Transcript_35438:21-266(-)
MCDIDPDFLHPAKKATVSELLSALLKSSGVRQIHGTVQNVMPILKYRALQMVHCALTRITPIHIPQSLTIDGKYTRIPLPP